MELYLPHSATWKQSVPRVVGDGGTDGSKLQTPAAVSAFFDPLSPGAAQGRFGLTGVENPFLVMLDPAECAGIVPDDVLVWDGLDYVVRVVRTFSFEEAHIEAVVSTRKRGRTA